MAASTVRAGFAGRAHSGVQISYRATKKCTSGFFEHRGCWRQVGVFIGPAGTLAQRRACRRRDNRGIEPRSRASVNSSLGPVLGRGLGLLSRRPSSRPPCRFHRHRVQQSVAVAPLGGLFATSGFSRTCGPTIAHSSRLTTRCSRRAAPWQWGESQRHSSAARG